MLTGHSGKSCSSPHGRGTKGGNAADLFFFFFNSQGFLYQNGQAVECVRWQPSVAKRCCDRLRQDAQISWDACFLVLDQLCSLLGNTARTFRSPWIKREDVFHLNWTSSKWYHSRSLHQGWNCSDVRLHNGCFCYRTDARFSRLNARQ